MGIRLTVFKVAEMSRKEITRWIKGEVFVGELENSGCRGADAISPPFMSVIILPVSY